MKFSLPLKPSLLRNMQVAFIIFGIVIGGCFPIYAEFFVDWKPGMYVWFYLSCLAAGAVIGIANAFLVKQILLKKLVRIAEVANAISNKDVSLQCNMQSDDVIGVIIKSFNTMAQTLRDLVTTLHAEADTLQASASALQSSTGEASNAAYQQQNSIDQVVASMNEMSATSHDVASNSAETAKETQDADEQGENAKVVIVEAMCAVDVLSEMVTTSSDVISRLEADSNNIGQVLSVINGIAEQTNLLALNAAIEAARAGEQGRGFAVVADEVRTLATRTQQSTQEITAMIESLQNGTREAVASMEKGKENATNGVTATESAVEALSIMSGAIGSIKDMNIRIASAAEEQNAVVTDVSQNVQVISNAIVNTTSSIENMRQAADDVTERANTIRNLISEFKI